MDGLILGQVGSNRPLFQFGGRNDLTGTMIPEGRLALTGPGEKLDAGHWPVRGDLAHIRLAGRFFVPHYAVPMPHRVLAETKICKTAHEDGDCLETMAAGTLFNVLDIAGGWAWGQVGEDGFVGYVPMSALKPE